MHKILAVALAGLLLQTSYSWSQTPQVLDPVVVTATRFAQPASELSTSTTVITANEIISSGARDLGEVLRSTTSLDVSSQGPRGAVSLAKIRGSSAEQVLVLLDGVRLNSQQNGLFDLNSLPVALKDIERIEIVRGPASALYGSAASGGVIQIFTRQPETKPRTSVTWREGSYDTRNFGVSHAWKMENLYYRIGANGDRSDGYRDNSALNQETYNGLVGMDLPGGYNIEGSAFFIDKKVEVPGTTSWLTPNARQRDRNIFSQLAVKGPTGPLFTTARLVYDRQKSQYADPDTWPGPTDDTHTLETIGSELQTSWKTGIHTLVFGGDYYEDDLDSTANGKRDQERWSLFTQYQIDPTAWASFLVGLRYDGHSDFRSVFSPRVGVSLFPTETTTVRLSAGKSFRAPTLNERFWPADFFTEGNPNLDPETAWEFELGVDQKLGRSGTIRIAGFMRQAEDLIQWSEGTDFIWRPTNIAKSRTWGAEASAEFRLHQSVLWGANYTYLRPKDRESGDYLLNIPHHQGSSFVQFGPFWDTSLRLTGRYARYYKDPSRRHPSYMVFDASLSRPFVLPNGLELELQVAAQNIFDKDYEINKEYPMPPAEIQVGLTAYF